MHVHRPAGGVVRRNGALLAGAAAALLALAAAQAQSDPAADLAAARRFQVEERWAPSESLATAALARIEGGRTADSLAIAEALHLIGVARWRTVGYADGVGRDAASRSLAIRSRRLGGGHLLVAEASALLARFLVGTGRPDSAVAYVRRALSIREASLAPDDTLIAKTWDQLALTHRDARDFRAALDAWTRAIAIREQVHGREYPEVARLIAQTGVPWMELGDLERARQVLEEALGIFARTTGPDHPDRWIPLNILASVELRWGNVARNLDLLQEALRVVRMAYGEDSREGLTLRTNISISLQRLSDGAGARAILVPLLPKLESQYGATHPRTISTRHGLALASRLMGDTAAAMSHLRELEAILAARPGPPDPLLTVVIAQQGEMLYRKGRLAEARARYERVLELERAMGRRGGDLLAEALGESLRPLFAIGDTAAVERTLQELVRIGERGVPGSMPAGYALQYDVALAARWLGKRDEAWDLALAAEQESRAHLHVNLQSLPDRRALLLTGVQETYLELVIELARAGGPRDLEAAWDRLARSRGMVRAEVARRRPAANAAADSGLALAHGRWMGAQRRLAQRLVSSGGAPRDSQARAAVDALRESAEQAEAAYARRLSERGTSLPPAEAGLAEVRARLRPDQALVACYRSRRTLGRWFQFAGRDTNDLYAFVVRGGNGPVALVELGTSLELRDAIDPWRARLAVAPGPEARPGDRAERECRRLGLKARAASWDRIAPHIAGAADVFVVADGILLDLPWQALPDGPNGYLAENGPRIHLIHAERELMEPAAPASDGSLLVFGSPDFDRGAGHEASPIVAALVRTAPDPCAGGTPRSLAPLPGSGAEAEAVARAWRAGGSREAVVRLGSEATESAFKREAKGRAVLHLATHGVVASDTCTAASPGARGVGGVELITEAKDRPRPAPSAAAARPAASSPARSAWLSRRVWIAMAGANRAAEHQRDENEGFLTAEEVLTMDLDGTEWVVLSACHSGLAEAWAREGTFGMRRAFDLAGVRTVIASQWAVDDDATRDWMEHLYRARARGETNAAAALQSASRAVLAARRKAGLTTHPFYWAAFSASGE
jgi:CHAT domain-containing protein/tetratricopeptide (TPR) repeat protein